MKTFRMIIAAMAILMAVGITRADDDFKIHRYDSFKAGRLNENSIVFIGNSITNMGNWHEQFSHGENVANRGNSGACSYEALENLETILIDRPGKIFVMIGTNDIGSQTGDPQSIARIAYAMIERVKNESPGTRMHIVSTFPSTNGYRSVENHQEINTLLKEVCEKTETPFIDLWQPMMGIIDNTISTDRLHITAPGYYTWSEALLPYMGEEYSVTMPATTEADNAYKWRNGNGLRVNMLSSLPISRNDVIMLGGEMINGGEWHELLGNENVKGRGATYGYGDYKTADWLDLMPVIFNLNKERKEAPNQIFLNIGSQDIRLNSNPDTLEMNYREMVKFLRKRFPKTKLNILSLTPVTDPQQKMATEDFNRRLEKLAAADKHVDYIDIYTPLANADGTPDSRYITTTLNAPYLSGRGYLEIARLIAPLIGGCTVMSDEEYVARHEMINARQALGNLISDSYTIPAGTSLEQRRRRLTNLRPQLYQLLNEPDATAAQLREAAAKYGALLTAPVAIEAD